MKNVWGCHMSHEQNYLVDWLISSYTSWFIGITWYHGSFFSEWCMSQKCWDHRKFLSWDARNRQTLSFAESLISLQDHSDDKNHAKSKSGLLWSPFCWSLQVKPKQIRMFFLDFLSCEVLKKVGRIRGFSSRWEQDGRGSDDPMSREMSIVDMLSLMDTLW